MMCLLIANVVSHLLKARLGNGYREIIVLPDEFAFEEALAVQPEGGFAFDKHHQFSDVLLGAESDQDVEVFGPAPDGI